jgi:hypothetical protein
VGFVVGQSGAGAGFLRVLRFPLQSSFASSITPQSPSCIIRGMYNRPMWPQCWDLQGPRVLEQRDLRNLNVGDLKKGPNGGLSPTLQKKPPVFYVTSNFCVAVERIESLKVTYQEKKRHK